MLRKSGRKYYFDYEKLEIINTPEKAYWLGFIYGDGSIDDNSLTIELNQRDVNHLEKFKDFMQYNGPIRKTRKNCYVLSLCSKDFVKLLINNKIVKNKTKIEIYPSLDDNLMIDFYRGCIDSDGWVTKHHLKNTNKVQYEYGLCSHHKNFLVDFKQFVLNKLHKEKIGCLAKNRLVHQIIIGGTNNFKLLTNLFYNNPSVYLDRKYNFIKLAMDDILSRVDGRTIRFKK